MVSINKEDMARMEVRSNLKSCTVPMFVVLYEVTYDTTHRRYVRNLGSFLQLLPNVENQISVWAEPHIDGDIHVHMDLVGLLVYSIVY